MARLTRPNGDELSGIRSIIDMLVADHGRESCPGAFAAPAGLTISKTKRNQHNRKKFWPAANQGYAGFLASALCRLVLNALRRIAPSAFFLYSAEPRISSIGSAASWISRSASSISSEVIFLP